VFQAQVLAPNAVFAVHEPPGGCTKNSYSEVVHPVAVAVKVTVVPGDCGDATLGLIQADVHSPGAINAK
jgi:hypothetical protein